MRMRTHPLTICLIASSALRTLAAVLYVDANSVIPVPPYTNWATAAVTIQQAVDAAVAGDLILVTNGVYRTGGRSVSATLPLTNRVAVMKAVTVQSVNGPAVTIIQGVQVPGTTNGIGAVRCVYLVNNAVLSGFTLTNGATLALGDIESLEGGGVFGNGGAGIIVSNCVLSGNAAYGSGGGAYVTGTLRNCTIVGNSSDHDGGGVTASKLENCVVTGNSAGFRGGGAVGGSVNNCIIVGNSAANSGGGVYGLGIASLRNCIVYENSAPTGANYSSASLNYCCTAPLPPSGVGNITSPPLFLNQAAGDLHLQSESPCINSGRNAYAPAGTDLDGNPRIAGGTVDIGAYEYQSPASTISHAWLQQYGLPTSGSADNTDLDGDGHNNWQEWKAGTNPTDNLSVLRMLNPMTNSSGLSVSWQSIAGRSYFLERATDLSLLPAFLPLKSNLTGQAGTTTYADTNAVGAGPFFYRVGVQE